MGFSTEGFMDRAFVYIDGFNLYHGAIRHSQSHWLNLGRMSELLLTSNKIVWIKYFTAMVSDTPDDPGKSLRQQLYHRALRTLPNIEIIKGQFRGHEVYRPIVGCNLAPSCMVRVHNWEEKGSDVNLAAHLVHDGHLGKYDTAVVISGDSDLAEPIRMVTQELKKRVGVINPRAHRSKELSKHATFYETLRSGVLHASQFPDEVQFGTSTIRKPLEWSVVQQPRNRRTIYSSNCPECPHVFSCSTTR